MAKVLLLNPPGDKLYLRDSYCGKISKAAYLTPPIDLIVISGYIYSRHQVSVLDAMAERLSNDEALKRIGDLNPDFIISLFGSASFFNDTRFFKLAKEANPGAKLIVSGDAGFDETEKLLRGNPQIDAVLLDYSSRAWLAYIEGDSLNARDIAFLDQGKYVSDRNEKNNEYSIGVPHLEMFPYKKYRMPFARNLPYAGIVTDFGCPFKCDFCLIGQMPYKLRPVAEVMDELRHFKQMGIRYFSFGDQTFGVDDKRTEELLRGMISEGLNIPWGCFTRADLVTEERLSLMCDAGCDMLMIGVESGDQTILDRHHKGVNLNDIRQAFALCKKYGIRTLATFIIGLPGENRETFEQTLTLAFELDPDYVSFNLPVGKPMTPLKENASRQGWLLSNKGDQSTDAGIASDQTTPEILTRWQAEAVRKFYLRPSYLMKRLSAIESFAEFRINLQEAAALFFGRR
jgi:radical SAM superfamily enzyme YgiQ (UPF0313 family)